MEITDTAGQDECTCESSVYCDSENFCLQWPISKNNLLTIITDIALRDQYMRANEGFVLVYDITNKNSLLQLKEFVTKIFQIKDSENVPIVFVGNKCDLEAQRKVSKEEAKTVAQNELGVKNPIIFEASAKKRVNVDESFIELVKFIAKLRAAKNPGTKPKKGLFGSSQANDEAKDDMQHVM